MKEGIHPKYQLVTVSCACGNTFQTRSTLPEIRLDICSQCHPFFTGKQKLVDSAGMVDRFTKRAAKKSTERMLRKAKPATKKVSVKRQKIKILSTSTKRLRPVATTKKKEKGTKKS